MPQRSLYLAAYDIAAPRRQRRVRQLLRAYASGGQYSAFECWLSEPEARALVSAATALLDSEADRFFLLRLDPRCRFRALGTGELPVYPETFYIG